MVGILGADFGKWPSISKNGELFLEMVIRTRPLSRRDFFPASVTDIKCRDISWNVWLFLSCVLAVLARAISETVIIIIIIIIKPQRQNSEECRILCRPGSVKILKTKVNN